MFAFLRRKSLRRETAARLYLGVVKEARRPDFYRDFGVPDTTDGRFEMVVLCGFFVFEALRKSRLPGAGDLAQQLFDHMFTDMDQSLREQGVGDLSVPRHMKRMMTGFNGRVTAYAQALEAGDRAALLSALRRNVYGTLETVDAGKVERLADWVLAQYAAMDAQSLMQGSVTFAKESCAA